MTPIQSWMVISFSMAAMVAYGYFIRIAIERWLERRQRAQMKRDLEELHKRIDKERLIQAALHPRTQVYFDDARYKIEQPLWPRTKDPRGN